MKRLRLLAAIGLLAQLAMAVAYLPSARVGFRHEPGVETNLVLGAGIAVMPGAGITLDGNIGFALLEQMGIAHYRLGATAYPLWAERLGLELAFEHDQWVEWYAGENRAVGMVRVRPRPGFEFGLGAAWRAPVYGDSANPDSYSSPFNWQSDWPEWNLLYELSWRFVSSPRFGLGAYLANHDGWYLRNPQQFPFGFDADYRNGDYLFAARLGSNIKGLSGLLFSLGELRLDLGVKRVF